MPFPSQRSLSSTSDNQDEAAQTFRTRQWNPHQTRQRWSGMWLGLVGFLAVGMQASPAEAAPRSIEVDATAELQVNPDVVDLHLRLRGEGRMPRQAIRRLHIQRDKMLAAFKQAGLSQKDLSVSHISIHPSYRRGEIRGYRATMSVVVCLKAMNRLGDFMQLAARQGVGSMSSYFRSTSIAQHKTKLRAMALKAAKAKASQIAKVMGVKITGVLHVKEVQEGTRLARYSNTFAYRRTASGGSSPIQPGAIRMKLRVRVSFEIK